MQDTFNEVLNAFANREQLVRKNALADQQMATNKAAGGQFAGGDFQGASNTLARSGNIADAQTVQTYSDTQRQQHAVAAQRISKGIRAAVAANHTPSDAYDMAIQAAPALGIDPAELQKMRPAYDQDPKAFLDFVDAQSAKALEPFTLSQGQNRYDGNNNLVASVAPEQKYVPVPEGGKLVPVPHGSAPAPSAPAAAPAAAPSADLAGAVDGFAGTTGATITSGARTPAHNAEVGGVPTSRHLTDQARDIVPPAGMSLAELGAQVQQQIPGAKVIVEKDHVHVQWGGAPAQAAAAPAGGDPAGTIYGNPKAKARPATAAEKAAYGVAADVPAQIKPDGSIDVVSGTGAAQRPVPATVKTAIASNSAAITSIDQAIAELKRNPNAMGVLNIFGDETRQRLDPNGVPTRAKVANIGSLIIHDRSGAAVTAAETPRLKPFVPMPTDNARTAIGKLLELRNQYAIETAAITSGYGPDTGYRPLTSEPIPPSPGASAPRAAPAKGSATPPASALQAGHITTFANGQKWTLRGNQPVRVQ